MFYEFLSCRKLTFHYIFLTQKKIYYFYIFNDNFLYKKNMRLLAVGESGRGKTTIIKQVIKEI